MAEETLESLNTVLPKELLIGILSRVEPNNPLELRRVCKLWNSLVLDSQFITNHKNKLFADISILFDKVVEHYEAFKLQHSDVMFQEEDEDEEDNEEEDEEGGVGGEEEDDDEEEYAAEEEEYNEEDEEEKEEVEEEEEDEEDEEEEMIQSFINAVDELDFLLMKLRIIKGIMKIMKVDIQIQPMEDRIKCLRSFMRIYLNYARSLSSHL